ncbi:MAG: MFS transporter [Pseudomonadota bacterium]|nr:MFS transporter [Pseudomonadota bacterium]
MDAAQGASWTELRRSGRFGQLVLLSFSVWLHAADELMVSTITPAMTRDIGGERYVAWLTALYEVGSIVAGAACALIVLGFGLRRTMGAAALTYLAGCLVSGFSATMEPMLLGRLVQGLGGGAMIATTFIAIHRLLPGHLTARAYAVISVVWGVSAFSGPMVGALFAEIDWWRGAFFVFACQSAALSVLAFTRLREPDSRAGVTSERGRGVGGLSLRIGLLALGVVAIASAGIEVAFARTTLLACLGTAMLAVFLLLDARAGGGRLLPYRPWDMATPQGAVIVLVLFISASTACLITYGPLLLTRLHGMDAVTIGFILLLESVGWSTVAIGLSGLPRRHESLAIAGGFAVSALTIAGFAYAVASGPAWLIALLAYLMGGGFGAAWAFMTRRATALAPAGEAERVASSIPTVQRLGYALGAAFVGIIANGVGFADDAGIRVAEQTSLWVFGLSLVPALIGLVAALRFVRFPEAGTRSA